MARYAIIKATEEDPNEGEVLNVIKWDGTQSWTAPIEHTVIMVDEGWHFGTGDLYNFITGEFWRPLFTGFEVDGEGYVLNRDGTRMVDGNGQWITAEVFYA